MSSRDKEKILDGDFRRQRLETLGTLSGGIAHDLNNVLTSILGHVSYLRLSLPPETSHGESLNAIEHGARRAALMTQQILEFARGEEREFKPVRLNQIIQGAISLLKAAIPKNIAIELNAGTDVPQVIGNDSQLSQLVMNLAINAVEALPDGGTIRITITLVTPQTSSALRELKVQTPMVELVIADNGTGIPAELVDKIFEPFFTTKISSGTGIGLATVARIIRAHNGEMIVRSKVDRGTSFSVYFPVCSENSFQDSSHSLPTIEVGTETILVVDDEESVRTVIQRSLQHLGYEVLVASGGREALEIFEVEYRRISLVILDMMMPVMSGEQLFGKLQHIDPKVRVLIASGYSSDESAQAVLGSGGLGFIQKPFSVEDLAQEIRRCMDVVM